MSAVPTGRRRSGGCGVVSVLLGLALFCALISGYAAPWQVYASSQPGIVIIDPSDGPVGTTVTIGINPPVGATGPVTYTLGTTLADPASDGCRSATPLSGVAPVVVGSQLQGGTAFTWPASLTQGPYWICATPNNGGSPLASNVPFTVTAPNAPAPTPTALPSTTATSVVAEVPAGGVLVGSTFQLAVSGWSSPLNTAPQNVELTTVIPSDRTSAPTGGYSALFTLASGVGAGDYVLTVTVPAGVFPATWYAYVSDQRGGAYSGAIKIIPPAAAAGSSHASSGSSSNGTAPSLLVVGILLTLALLMLVVLLVRRRARLQRLRVEQQQRERQIREQQIREQQYRQQQYRQQQQFYGQPWSQQPPQPSREEWARTQRPSRDPRYPRQ